MLNNFCEQNNEALSDDKIAAAIAYDKDAQPGLHQSYRSECNGTEGKRVRRD